MFAARWWKSEHKFNFFLTSAFLFLVGCKNPFGETKIGEDFHPGVEISFTESVLSLSLSNSSSVSSASSNSQSAQATAQSAQVTAGSIINLVISLKDKNGSPYISNSVTIALSSSGGTSIGSFSSAVNNKDGTYTVIYSASQAGTPVTITGTVNGQTLSGSATIEVLPNTNVSTTYPFSLGTETSYTSSNSFSTVEITASGILRLKPVDQTDDDNSSTGFGGSTMSGTQWDSSLGALRLNTSINNAELDSTWAPQWGNLVGYWKLNGNATDSTGISSGTMTGSASYTTSAKIGSHAAQFVGTASQISIPHQATQDNLTEYTMMLWMYLDSDPNTTAGNDYRFLFTKGTWTQMHIVMEESGVLRASYYTGSDPNADRRLATASTVTSNLLNKWVHVVGTFNSATGKVILYLNGAAAATANFTAGLTLNPSSADIHISEGGSTGLYFPGKIDDVAIWKKTLTPTEIANIYSRQSAKYSGLSQSRVVDALTTQTWTDISTVQTLPFYKELPGSSGSEASSAYSAIGGSLMNGLVGYWNLNSNFNAQVGTNLTASAAGAAITNTDSKLGSGSAVFTSNAYAYTAISSTYAFPNTTFSTAFWFKTLSCSGSQYLIADGAVNSGWGIRMYTGSLGLFLKNASNSQVDIHVSKQVCDNQWHHAVFVITTNTAIEAGNSALIYIDGASQAVSTTLPGNGAYADPSATYGLSFAARAAPGGASDFFPGSLDEVAIWSRALSASEVLELYRRGANRIKYQVRSCANSDCSDQEALTSNYKGWKGPDSTGLTYFSELYNTTNNVLSGTVSTAAPTITFSNFGGSGLSVASNRYFQYRTILESDDQNSLCTYGGSAANCSPELKSVSVGPVHFDSTSPSVYTNTGLSFYSLSTMTQTLGASCSGGITYNLSLDKTNWYYWDVTASGGSGAWALANGTVARSNTASTINSHLSSFGNQVGRGTVYTKFYLGSSGLTPCEIDSLKIEGMQ